MPGAKSAAAARSSKAGCQPPLLLAVACPVGAN
jgi:hypothetical protein